jgi:hypothetical protein
MIFFMALSLAATGGDINDVSSTWDKGSQSIWRWDIAAVSMVAGKLHLFRSLTLFAQKSFCN